MRIIISLVLFLSSVNVLAAESTGLDCPDVEVKGSATHVSESYIEIGGIQQWVSLRTSSCKHPLLLMVHGGPGNPSSYYTNAFFKELEKHFIVVHWDQRGAGRTLKSHMGEMNYDDYEAKYKLSVSEMVKDGIAVSEYLIKQLNKDKLVLRAGSWGAFLATSMAKTKPELFHAVVNHSLLINAVEKHQFGFIDVLMRARRNDNDELVAQISKLGPPPYDHPRKYGQLYRIVKKLEADNATFTTKESTYVTGYDSEIDQKFRGMGDDYSWMNFIGFDRLGIKGMLEDINLYSLGYEFDMPIYILQGGEDLTTPARFSRPYYDKIKAPAKDYVVIPDAGHEPNDAMLEKELDILIKRVLPKT